MSAEAKPNQVGRFLSRLGLHREKDGASTGAAEAGEGTSYPTKALKKFLSYLSSRTDPVLLDLGPVIGPNIDFFGEQLGCKIFVEDLFADLDRHVRSNTLEEFPKFLAGRFPQPDASVDGILCWDLFDFLDRPSGEAVARELTRLLRVSGALLGFFGTAAYDVPGYTKFVVINETTLRHRPYPSARPRQRVLLNRDIIKLFDQLRVSDSFLLQTNLREILFRKPQYRT